MRPHNKLFAVITSLLLLACTASKSSNSSVRTVCSSGCEFSTVQQAINAADEGDVIELRAGETFAENVFIVGKNHLTIRSSRWQELPSEGYRIDPDQHAELLATIQSNTSDPALEVGAAEHNMAQNGLDVNTDFIQFDWTYLSSRFSEGMMISCMASPEYNAVMPEPLVAGKRYYVRDWDANNFRARLSETPNGPPVDLTSVGSTPQSFYYSRPRCARWEQPKDIVIEGIRFAVGGTTAPRNLIRVGHNLEVEPAEMGPGVEFRHSVITGRKDDLTGPLFCLAFFGGRDHKVIDSWIGHCKAQQDESKGIAIQNTVGALIRNNYISAASINILTAGGDSASLDVNRNITIEGNFIEKQGYMMYKEGTGAPTGECYYGGGSGAFYRRLDVTPNTCGNGACYTCDTNNAWQLDTAAYYRPSNYLNKNLLEFKDCEDCVVDGNMFRGSYGGPDAGQGWCFGISVIVSTGFAGGGSSYHRAHNVTISNNWADYCYTGLQMTSSSYNGAVFANFPQKNILVYNNLFTNLGWYPAMSQFPDPNTILRFGIKQSTGVQGFRFINNTMRARSTYHTGVAIYAGQYPDVVMHDYQFNNNLIQFNDYSVFLTGVQNTCTPTGLFSLIPNDGASRFRDNVFFGGATTDTFGSASACRPMVDHVAFEQTSGVGFTSATNHRLQPTSRYSAFNPSPSFLSADVNTDVGADVDVIEQYALPAQWGEPPMAKQLEVKVVPGSTSAEISFRRSDDNACSVTLYAQRARIPANELPDTNSNSRKQDSRSSSVMDGSTVHFIAGAISPLTPRRPYWYLIDCGSRWAIGQFHTRATGSGARLEPQFRHPSAASVRIEYSPTQDFTASTSLSTAFAGGKASVPVQIPSGYYYWRSRLLDSSQQTIEVSPVQVFVAP